MKRIADIVISIVLLVVTAPLMLVAAISIVLTNDGPVLFRQVRVGLHGRKFEILKFRTMTHVGHASGITIGRDPRITRVGHVLRQTKIDELPQLLNVLKGDMSLVGPRPEVPEYYALYPETDREIISSFRPGITDRASIIYRNEADLLAKQDDPAKYYREIILPHKVTIGLDYVRNQSLWRDFVILVDTLRAVLTNGRTQ
jgi:lipopolysaccharide/colanic/teichoic acid biosynthesis glycosyltransferase